MSVTILVANLQPLWAGTDERFHHEGVNRRAKSATVVPQGHAEIVAVPSNGVSPERLTLGADYSVDAADADFSPKRINRSILPDFVAGNEFTAADQWDGITHAATFAFCRALRLAAHVHTFFTGRHTAQ